VLSVRNLVQLSTGTALPALSISPCGIFLLPGFLVFREEEGIELQVLSSKQSSETPPVGCSSRNSYIEPQQGAGTDADSINSSEYPAEEVTFKNGSSTIGELRLAV